MERCKSQRTVSRGINGLGELGDRNFEPLLNLLEHFLVLVRGHECDGKSLCAETPSATKKGESQRGDRKDKK